jgi:hypothetical protein
LRAFNPNRKTGLTALVKIVNLEIRQRVIRGTELGSSEDVILVPFENSNQELLARARRLAFGQICAIVFDMKILS